MKKEYIIGGLALVGGISLVAYLNSKSKIRINSEGFFNAVGRNVGEKTPIRIINYYTTNSQELLTLKNKVKSLFTESLNYLNNPEAKADILSNYAKQIRLTSQEFYIKMLDVMNSTGFIDEPQVHNFVWFLTGVPSPYNAGLNNDWSFQGGLFYLESELIIGAKNISTTNNGTMSANYKASFKQRLQKAKELFNYFLNSFPQELNYLKN
jgi:hypothetical protein